MNIRELHKITETKDQDMAVRVLLDGAAYDISEVAVAIDPAKPETYYVLTLDDRPTTPTSGTEHP